MEYKRFGEKSKIDDLPIDKTMVSRAPVLKIIKGGPAREIVLDKDILTVGRDKDNDIVFEQDLLVSGRHCRLEKRNGRYFIKDLKSKNGTLVNGEKIEEAELKEGRLINIGDLVLEYREVTNPFYNHRPAWTGRKVYSLVIPGLLVLISAALVFYLFPPVKKEAPELEISEPVVSTSAGTVQTETKDEVQELFGRAMLNYNQGEYKEALIILEKIKEKQPDYTPAKKKEQEIKKILEQEKKLAVLYEEGKGYYQNKQYSKALNKFSSLAGLSPNYKDVQHYMVETQQGCDWETKKEREKRKVKKPTLLQPAKPVKKETPEPVSQKDLTKAHEYYQEGRRKARDGDVSGARECWEKVCNLIGDPQNELYKLTQEKIKELEK